MWRCPTLNGIEAARQISAKLPQTAMVFLSMHSDEGYVLKALKAGRAAYLLKDSAEYDLINAVTRGERRQGVLQPGDQQDAGGGLHAADAGAEVEDSYELLTTREREVLQLLAEGEE